MADQITTPSGLKYEDIEAGTGAAAAERTKSEGPLHRLAEERPEIRLVERPQ